MRVIIPVVWPGRDAETFFTLEVQQQGISPEAYVTRKKLLAILADIAPVNDGVPNFGIVPFKTRLRSGFSVQNQIMISTTPQATTTCNQLEERVREVGSL